MAERDLSPHTMDPVHRFVMSITPLYKRLAYRLLRPALDAWARGWLSSTSLALPHLSHVYPERGMPLEHRRAWAVTRLRKPLDRVLVQGTGSGWDALTWARLQPRLLLAVDLFPFFRAWRVVERHCDYRGWTRPKFLQSTLDVLPLRDCELDFLGSDSVLEHCRDLRAVMREAFRVMRPSGFLYAQYGPLWFCFGGDHFSGSSGRSEEGYHHLLLDRSNYRAYVAARAKPGADAQDGDRYISLDLFSRLTTREYLTIFEESGFEIVDLMLEISRAAVSYARARPEDIDRLLARWPHITTDDLRIKGNFVLLRKPERQAAQFKNPL